jgi:molybdenum cofactor guanylyltransferase
MGFDNNDCTGIVLAGGNSTRMGLDKGRLKWKGRLLIDYSIEALKPFCKEILISANFPEYANHGYTVIADKYQGIGPMAGLHAGLSASSTGQHIFLSCDMPLINHQVIQLLLDHSPGFQAVAPSIDGRLFPVCAWYHKSALAVIEEEIEAGLHKTVFCLNRLKTLKIDLSNTVHAHKFININTPKDFESLTTMHL